MINVIDFFSGCGGTSCGFKSAGLDIALGIDVDFDASLTYKNNFPEADFLQVDIRELNPIDLSPWIAKGKPTLFCGCAPCQPFSRQNRSKSSQDPRRNLLNEFSRFIEYWKPDYIFVENVPGMQRIEGTEGPLAAFTESLSNLGYHYQLGVLPALWFGVPQVRERLVLIATKTAPIELPKPTHGPGKLPFGTVRNWIDGLPAIAAGQTHPDDNDHRAAVLTEINLSRIKATPEGGSRDSWSESLWLDCHKQHKGHKDVYGRLAWDKPAAGLTTRCISYSNGRFGHPEQHRAISVREAACLQTFPRKFNFFGNLNSKARQIGNAVPPLMAQAIGSHILSHAIKHQSVITSP